MKKRTNILEELKLKSTISISYLKSYALKVMHKDSVEGNFQNIEDYISKLESAFESQRNQTHKNFQYVDQKNHQINKLCAENEELTMKNREYEEFLCKLYKAQPRKVILDSKFSRQEFLKNIGFKEN